MKKIYLIIALITMMSLTGCLTEAQNKCFEEKGKQICKEENLEYIKQTYEGAEYVQCNNWTRQNGNSLINFQFNETEKDECHNAKEIVTECVKHPICNIKCKQKIK